MTTMNNFDGAAVEIQLVSDEGRLGGDLNLLEAKSLFEAEWEESDNLAGLWVGGCVLADVGEAIDRHELADCRKIFF